jgi:hypothetical protein
MGIVGKTGLIKNVVVEFGPFMLDTGLLSLKQANQQELPIPLVEATGFVYSLGYYGMPRWRELGASGIDLTNPPLGLFFAPVPGNNFIGYVGNKIKLFQVDPLTGPYNWTDISGASAPFNATAALGGWSFAGFGQNVIAADYADDCQIRVNGAGNFQKLAQSGGGNPGMDPKAHYCGAVRDNFFLANCNLAAPFDGLAAGANPQLVCWSQDDNCRQYGSFNATPQLIGAGFQPINNDSGEITGFIGGDEYGLIAQQRSWIRIDGPPYSFGGILHGCGCRFPRSIVRVDRDVFYWGVSGPTRIPYAYYGAIQQEELGYGTVSRALTDPTLYSKALPPAAGPLDVCVAYDSSCNTIFWLVQTATPVNPAIVAYNVTEKRFTVSIVTFVAGVAPFFFLATAPVQQTSTFWFPGSNLLGVGSTTNSPKITQPISGDTNALLTLTTKYAVISEGHAVRVRRVRPIYDGVKTTPPLSLSLTLYSKNTLYAPPVVTAQDSAADSHGYLTFSAAPLAELNAFSLSGYSDTPGAALRFTGLQVEYEEGPVYAQ